MFSGHYSNRFWYDKQDPMMKLVYKTTSTIFKIEEDKRKRTIADPLSYVGSKPDIKIRYTK